MVINLTKLIIESLYFFLGSYIEPFCEVVLVNLTQILMNQDQSMKSLTENAAITMGRIGKACPLIVAPHLPKFINQWYLLLQYAGVSQFMNLL